MVLVKLAAALICFAGHCYPALVGVKTPVGIFPIVPMHTNLRGYGGDVLVFARDKAGYYAIHRVWLLNPNQHREDRLESGNPKDRLITNGCVNISPIVYVKLKDCCSTDKLEIVR